MVSPRRNTTAYRYYTRHDRRARYALAGVWAVIVLLVVERVYL